MARRIKVSGWRPGPNDAPVQVPVEFLVAESWAEQGYLLDAFLEAGRPDRPTLALGGIGDLPYGPTAAEDTARWGLRLDRTDLDADRLEREFERAAIEWRDRHHHLLAPPVRKAPPEPARLDRPEARRKGRRRREYVETVQAPAAPPTATLTALERRVLIALARAGILSRRQLGDVVEADEARGESVVEALARKLNGPAARVIERVPATASGPAWRLDRTRLPPWLRPLVTLGEGDERGP